MFSPQSTIFNLEEWLPLFFIYKRKFLEVSLFSRYTKCSSYVFMTLGVVMSELDGIPSVNENEPTRRDFLILTTATMGVVGAAGFIWPLIDSMNPAADVLALSTVDVDLKPIAEGQNITVVWQGKPVFIRHRTPAEIENEKTVPLLELKDPQTDEERFTTNPKWLVVVGICTHLGCVPLGQKASDPKGKWGGWYCPCHGSEYDLSGRIRKGPAPVNLPVPKYAFIDDNTLRIGVSQEEIGKA